MSTLKDPFNIKILKLDKHRLRTLKETTSIEIYKPGSKEFDEDGLFSATTYGVPGDPARDEQFSFIDTKTEIFHPYAIYLLKKLKRLYVEIINGREYAVFDEETKDFVRSNELDGETGFHFFVKYLPSLEFKQTGSKKRKHYIDIFESYRNEWLTRYVMIMPAGLRDIDINERGKVSKDPINDHYRRIIANARLVDEGIDDESLLDQSRVGMQTGFNDAYQQINDFMSGKTGFYLKNFASRAIHYGTRNVITSLNISSEKLGDYNSIGDNDTLVGLFQHAKAIEPVSKHLLKKNFIDKVFVGHRKARLIDKDTLKSEYVDITTDTYDRWQSAEGIGKIINEIEYPEMRHKPVVIENKYAALIYDDNQKFKIFHGIEDLPSSFDKKYVRPISRVEMIHLSGYMNWSDYPAWITRYPAIEIGSTYPSIPKIMTTLSQKSLIPMNDNWEVEDESKRCHNFPDNKVKEFFETLSPNPSRLAGLGADFDGDMVSYNANITDEARLEILGSFKKASTYLDIDGGFRNPLSSDYSDMVSLYLTYKA